MAKVEPPFFIVDNDDESKYFEFGDWNTSVAQAYGPSSRYSFLNQIPRAYAEFIIELEYAGNYNVQMIVPTTVNSTDKAIYKLSVNGIVLDSVTLNQNTGSGDWVDIFENILLPSNETITIKVIDSGLSTTGDVLRADALKFSLIENINSVDNNSQKHSPEKFYLEQNYPNPFNMSTIIKYWLPKTTHVSLIVYDIAGNELVRLVDERRPIGDNYVMFNSTSFSIRITSGIYFYSLITEEYRETKKMILLK
jgi:hypothetical protein